MAIRNIVKNGDELLRKKSRVVEQFDQRLWTLLDDMTDTMRKADGAGLAAVQVGVLKRAVVVEVDDQLIELINPVIVEAKGKQRGAEGCLSFPGEWGTVTRPMHVTVKAQDRYGKEFTVSGSELMARAFCHELDHLDGKLYVDIAEEMIKE